MKFKGRTLRAKELHYTERGLEIEFSYVDENNLVHGGIQHRLLVTEDSGAQEIRSALAQLMEASERWAMKIHFDDVGDDEMGKTIHESFGIAESLGGSGSNIDDPG